SRAAALRAKGKFPRLPASVVPTITTGIDAIGRGNDFDRLHTYVSFLTETLGPDRAARRLNDGELAARSAAALGIVDDGLIKTDEEIAEEDERAREAAIQQAAIGPAINQIGQMARLNRPAFPGGSKP